MSTSNDPGQEATAASSEISTIMNGFHFGQDTASLTEFACFSELPAELRLKIFKMAASPGEPHTVTVLPKLDAQDRPHLYEVHPLGTQHDKPYLDGLALACRDSRLAVTSHSRLTDFNGRLKTKIWWHPEDTMIFHSHIVLAILRIDISS
jgi:hypothetical protein